MQSEKSHIRKVVGGFLRQRKAAYRIMSRRDPNMIWKEAKVLKMIDMWSMIERYDYWRHCLQVADMANDLIDVLPSSNGNHKKIRLRILDIIAHCRAIKNIPHDSFVRKNLT